MLHALRHAGRVLLKQRAFSLLAIFVLALGIGGVATQFSVINGMLLRLPAFPAAERLMNVSLVNTVRGQAVGGAAMPDFLDWRASQQSFEELAAYASRFSINVTFQDTPRRYNGVYVTHSLFRTLGVAPTLGRDFTADDDKPGAPRTIIISHRIWQNDFNGIPDIVGQAVRVNGQPGTVIGVMPDGFCFPSSEQLWSPVFTEFQPVPRGAQGGFGGAVIGRLKPGVSPGQATAEFSASAKQASLAFPRTNGDFGAAQVTPLAESFFGPQLRQMLYVMLGAVVAVLLIACVNVMNMQFAHAARRMREIALRSALGASRWQLLRQMLVESLVLSACGALVGTLIAWWSSDALLEQIRAQRNPPPAWVTFDLDGRVLAVTILVTAGAALLSGLIPAWLATRSRPLDILREGGRGGTDRKVNTLTNSLVVFQIALTTALLVVSLFMARSIINQQRFDWGYDTSTVLTARMSLFQADHPTPAALGLFFDKVLQTLRADPHFSVVALTTRFRLALSNNGSYEVDGATYPDERSRPNAAIEPISDRYFEALGMQMVAGRDFSLADTLDQQPVAIVNGAFARRHFGNESPLGRRVRLAQGGNAPGPWMTIVGVAPDTRMQGPYDERSDGAGIFQPITQAPQRFLTVVVRGPGGSPARLADPLRKAMARVDSNQPIYMINTADRLIDDTLAQNRMLAVIFSVFGGVAMLLAAVGLYGVMSFAVSQRTIEYGIRMALGANAGKIRRMILRQGGMQLALGLGLGLALAIVLMTTGQALMQGFLYRVSQADPFVWSTPILLLTVVALLACLVPARRATRVDPMEALRAE